MREGERLHGILCKLIVVCERLTKGPLSTVAP
jgi:hypothetical protein